ncbi:uncharacterized protein LOC115627593 [Scaptodrosophila lebanonensis]|uniref:Uncharacterized protein LOC115627593 n=1 Tax=Drosophila lebanonensis TaxID=7225 RepID=A0A6J2TT20_DROLE|nr:uncharacterized protein LOC115627593 [Scaptodrosophila lebanonensis]
MHRFEKRELTRDFDIRWVRCNCTPIDLERIAIFTCGIEEIPKRQGNFLNSLLVLENDLHRFLVEVTVELPLQQRHQRQQLFKGRINGCQLMGYQSKSRVLNAVLKKLVQSGNYPKQCPLLAHVNYTSTHFTLNPDHFPPYTPDMKFITKLEFYADKNIPRAMFKVLVEAEVLRRSPRP